MIKRKLTAIVLGPFLVLSGLAGLVSGLGGLGLVMAPLAVATRVLIFVGLLYNWGCLMCDDLIPGRTADCF